MTLAMDAIPVSVDLSRGLGWEDIPIHDVGEALVPLGFLSEYGSIFTSAVYFGEMDNSPYRGALGIADTLITLFARRSVAQGLVRAQELLPAGMRLVVMDAYRPVEVQASLYGLCAAGLRRRNPGWDSATLLAETRRFVSVPSADPRCPSPHSTGGAVDLAIVGLDAGSAQRLGEVEERLRALPLRPVAARMLLEFQRSAILRGGQWLEFGSRFDEVAERSGLAFFETLAQQRRLSVAERLARDHRRMLHAAMVTAGLQPYAEEWWHFNSLASQMGARVAGRPAAEHGAAVLSPANRRWEAMRRRLHRAATAMCDGVPEAEAIAPAGLRNAIRSAVETVGDPRRTSFPPAANLGAPPGTPAVAS